MKRLPYIVLSLLIAWVALIYVHGRIHLYTPPIGQAKIYQTGNLKTEMEGVWFPLGKQTGELSNLWIYVDQGKWIVRGAVNRPRSFDSHNEVIRGNEALYESALRPLQVNPLTGSFSKAMAIFRNSRGDKALRLSLRNGHLAVEQSSYITEPETAKVDPPPQYLRRMNDPLGIRLWNDVNALNDVMDLQHIPTLKPIFDDLISLIGSTTDVLTAQSRLETAIDRIFPEREPASLIQIVAIPVGGTAPGLLVPFKIYVQSFNTGEEHHGYQYLWFVREKSAWTVRVLKFPKNLMSERNYGSMADLYMPGCPRKAISTKDHLFVTIRDESTNFTGCGALVFKHVGKDWQMTQRFFTETEAWVVDFGQKNGKNDPRTMYVETNSYLNQLPGCHASPDAHWREDYVLKKDRYVKVREVYLPTAASTADDLICWGLKKNLKKIREHCASEALANRFMKLIRDHPLSKSGSIYDGSYDYEDGYMSTSEEDTEFAPKSWGVFLCLGKMAGKWMLVGIRPLEKE